LSSDLMRQLDAVDVYGMPHANATPLYRVNVNVRRFDSWPGSRAMLDAVWSVRGLTCHTRVAAPAGVGFDALVIAHQHNLAQLSRDIATAIRALAASAPAACPQ